MRAVIMAGGLGTRLRPLTTGVPKPLLPVVGRPMVEHALLLARKHGVQEAVLTVQHLAPMIRRRIGGGGELGITVTYATESRPLGTAGGVRLAVQGADDDHLLVLSADAVTDMDLGAMMGRHLDSGADMTLALTRREDPREFGLVDADEQGWVRRFHEKPEWGEIFTDTVSTGIYVVKRTVLERIPVDAPIDWSTDVIPKLLAEHRPVAAIVMDSYWEDVGDLAAYRQVQIDALDGAVALDVPGVDRGDGVWVGEGAEISPGADVVSPSFIGARSVIEDGAQLGPYAVLGAHCLVRDGVTVERSTVHDNVYLGREVTLRGSVVGRGTEVGARSRVGEAAIVADGCVLEQEVEVASGSLIYPGKVVESGTSVTGSLVWDAKGHRSVIGVDGMCGEIGVEVTPESVVRLAGALATMVPRGSRVALGRDHSAPASAYVAILAGALRAHGLSVQLLRAVPLPIVRDHVRHHAEAGIYLRLARGVLDALDLVVIRSDGRNLGERSREMNRLYERREFRRAIPEAIGALTEETTAVGAYIERIRQRVPGGSGGSVRVVIDVMGGSAGNVVPLLFDGTSVELVLLGTQPDSQAGSGDDDHRRARLNELCDIVVSTRAALGLAIDPTGEQLFVVDEAGRLLTDDRALLVVLDLAAAESHGGEVVLPSTASRVAEKVAHFHGVHVRRVLHSATFSQSDEALLICDGEGGFAVPGAGGQRDAIAAAYALVGWMTRTQLPLSVIDERIPETAALRLAVATPWRAKASVLRAVAAAAEGRRVDHADGLCIYEDDGAWCLILPDPAEPRMRLWVESSGQERSGQIADHWMATIRRIVSSEPSARG